MSRFRTPPRYDIASATEVYVGDRKVYVFLGPEVVVQEIAGRNGKRVLRRVTSRSIETSALLRASDKAHAVEA